MSGITQDTYSFCLSILQVILLTAATRELKHILRQCFTSRENFPRSHEKKKQDHC